MPAPPLAALAPLLAALPSQANLSGRLVLAAVLGGAIGLEREVSEHPAGLRTHMTVALGAALFGVLRDRAEDGLSSSEDRHDRDMENPRGLARPHPVKPSQVDRSTFVGGLLDTGAQLDGAV